MIRSAVVVLVASGLAISAARAGVWETATYSLSCTAFASAEDPFDFFTQNNGGTFPGFYPGALFGRSAHVDLSGGGFSDSTASTSFSASGDTLLLDGSAISDVDSDQFMIAGFASGDAEITVEFTLPSGGTYSFPSGSFDGVHADSSGGLYDEAENEIISFSQYTQQPAGQSGTLVPGTYQIRATANASSNFNFFNGLFAGASFFLEVVILPIAACPGDLNTDGLVDDSDFTIFVAAYNILDCADPSMPEGCPADLNGDGFVDDTDFILFVGAYNQLLCP